MFSWFTKGLSPEPLIIRRLQAATCGPCFNLRGVTAGRYIVKQFAHRSLLFYIVSVYPGYSVSQNGIRVSVNQAIAITRLSLSPCYVYDVLL